jgi:hypothetical protein
MSMLYALQHLAEFFSSGAVTDPPAVVRLRIRFDQLSSLRCFVRFLVSSDNYEQSAPNFMVRSVGCAAAILRLRRSARTVGAVCYVVHQRSEMKLETANGIRLNSRLQIMYENLL